MDVKSFNSFAYDWFACVAMREREKRVVSPRFEFAVAPPSR